MHSNTLSVLEHLWILPLAAGFVLVSSQRKVNMMEWGSSAAREDQETP